MKVFVVMTTIAKPSSIFNKILEVCLEKKYNVVVVGDKKTPNEWDNIKNIIYIPWKEGELTNSYSRKNMGYLYALSQGATHIFDLDDDNTPLAEWGQLAYGSYRFSNPKNGWTNIYKLFCNEEIWPRGLPLSSVDTTCNFHYTYSTSVAIWQSLCDEDPDTDAIFRLLNKERKIYFFNDFPIVLDKETICPINSQNTLFYEVAFPLLYLPNTVTMRFSDILRGIIAQPILWNFDYLVGFTQTTASHKRHEHDLMKDFYDEIPCYQNIKKVYDIVLKTLDENITMEETLINCYKNLYNNGIVTQDEIEGVEVWVRDIIKYRRKDK